MLQLFTAGNVGRDAEYKTTQGGHEICSFSLAAETGFGDNKATVWVDVSKWGKGAQGLARVLRKGSRVAVTGEMSLREHNGKTYVQCRADNIKILGTPNAGDDRTAARREDDGWVGQAPDDDADGIPF